MSNNRANEIYALNAEIDRLQNYIHDLEQSNTILDAENKQLRQKLSLCKNQFATIKTIAVKLLGDMQ
jgi:regulator of replication initiation timing